MTARFVPISAYTLPDNSLTQKIIAEALRSTNADRSHVLEEEVAEVEPKVILQSIQKQVTDQYQAEMNYATKIANASLNLIGGNKEQRDQPNPVMAYAQGDQEAPILFSIQATDPSSVVMTELQHLNQRCKEVADYKNTPQNITCKAVLGSEDLQRRLTPKTP